MKTRIYAAPAVKGLIRNGKGWNTILGPPSTTLAQQKTNIGPASHVCRVVWKHLRLYVRERLHSPAWQWSTYSSCRHCKTLFSRLVFRFRSRSKDRNHSSCTITESLETIYTGIRWRDFLVIQLCSPVWLKAVRHPIYSITLAGTGTHRSRQHIYGHNLRGVVTWSHIETTMKYFLLFSNWLRFK